MFQKLGVEFAKSIRRRVIVPRKNFFRKQMRLTNIQPQLKKPTRFTYRIEYTTLNNNGGMNFIPHLISEK